MWIKSQKYLKFRFGFRFLNWITVNYTETHREDTEIQREQKNNLYGAYNGIITATQIKLCGPPWLLCGSLCKKHWQAKANPWFALIIYSGRWSWFQPQLSRNTWQFNWKVYSTTDKYSMSPVYLNPDKTSRKINCTDRELGGWKCIDFDVKKECRCDRFLIIDNAMVYHIGASLKDLGKKWFAFSKIQLDAMEMLDKLNKS